MINTIEQLMFAINVLRLLSSRVNSLKYNNNYEILRR